MFETKLDKFFDYFMYVVIVGFMMAMIAALAIVVIVCPPFIVCIILALIGGSVLYHLDRGGKK